MKNKAFIFASSIVIALLSMNIWAAGKTSGYLSLVVKGEGGGLAKWNTYFKEVEVFVPQYTVRDGVGIPGDVKSCYKFTANDLNKLELWLGTGPTSKDCKGNLSKLVLKYKNGGEYTLINSSGTENIPNFGKADEKQFATCSGNLEIEHSTGLVVGNHTSCQ